MGNKTVIATILAILALAAFFRFYLIAEIPPGLYPDEAANGNNALEALRAGDFKIFYPENNGREGLFINLQALAIKLFGAEPWTLRIVSAIIGTLTVLGIYLLTKELFNSQFSIFNFQSSPNYSISKRFENWPLKIENSEVALLAAFFMATSYWHINFSRIGFRAIMVPFFAVFGMYWLLKALRTEKISSAVLAGISTGFGFYTYIAFRFMPFVFAVPIIAALVSWFRGKKAQHCVPCVVALYLFITFIVALPIGLYFLQNPQDFFGRGGQVSIFSAQSPSYEFAKSTVLTLGMFNIWGDCNQRHNLNCAPELFWPIGILFIIGLIITIRNLFKKPLSPISYTLFAWFLFMMFPATLTREGLPHALRAIGMIPPIMIFAGMGGMWLWQYLRFRVSGLGFRVLIIAAVLFLIWIPINTYRDYFIRFAYAPETQGAFAADLWQQGQYLDSLPDTTQKFVIVNLSGDDIREVPAPAQTIMLATDTFDQSRRRSKNFQYVTDFEQITIDPKEKAVILPLNPNDTMLIAALRQKFPQLRPRIIGDTMIFENQIELTP